MSNERAVRLEWVGGERFEARGTVPPSPAIAVDGETVEGPSPMLLLLMAAGSCSGADVVMILGKMRVTVKAFSVDVTGIRRDEDPRRYLRITYHYRIESPDARRDQVERAVELSLGKYCSVIQSMASDMVVDHEITLG